MYVDATYKIMRRQRWTKSVVPLTVRSRGGQTTKELLKDTEAEVCYVCFLLSQQQYHGDNM